MHPSFETIYIPRNTFGTRLKFTLFSADDLDESVSGYTHITLRAFNPRGEEEFSGSVDESLPSVTDNVVHYTFVDGDLKNRGIYELYLELLQKSGTTITAKNSINVGKIKVE